MAKKYLNSSKKYCNYCKAKRQGDRPVVLEGLIFPDNYFVDSLFKSCERTGYNRRFSDITYQIACKGGGRAVGIFERPLGYSR